VLQIQLFEIVEAVLQKTREHLGHGFFALAVPGYLYAAVQREAGQGGVSILDDNKVQGIMGKHLDAAGAFWRASSFTPEGNKSLYSTRLVKTQIVALLSPAEMIEPPASLMFCICSY
jgi:hypothetical protein